MNILLVSYNYPPAIGGLERQSHLLARLLVARGHRVRVVAARLAGSPERELLDGVEVHRVAPGNGSRWRRMSTFLMGLVQRVLSSAGWIDVIQVQQALYPAAVTAVVARAVGRPVLVRNACSGPPGAVQLMCRLPFGTTALWLIARLSTAVSLNDEMTAEMRDAGFQRIASIPNGVEIPPATTPEARVAARSSLAVTGPTVLFLGRLEPEKSVDVLLRAWPLVRTVGARLLIVGDGSARATLERQAAAFGPVSRTIDFRGASADPSPYLRAADVLAHPSQGEGLSNAILEGMAHGLPVIASAIAGNRQLIESPALGRLVPWGDHVALAEELDRMLGDPDGAGKIGRAGRAHVAARYSPEAMVAAYERLYAELSRRRP